MSLGGVDQAMVVWYSTSDGAKREASWRRMKR